MKGLSHSIQAASVPAWNSEIESTARLLFDVSVTSSDLDWAQRAWTLLPERAAEDDMSARERLDVFLTLCALRLIYEAFSRNAYDERTDVPLGGSAKDAQKELGLVDFFLGVEYGMRTEGEIDHLDPEGPELSEVIEELAHSRVDAIRAAIVTANSTTELLEAFFVGRAGNPIESANVGCTHDWFANGCPV
jgi:hypothetical protein